MLYYLYTDGIHFLPLASNWTVSLAASKNPPRYTSRRAFLLACAKYQKTKHQLQWFPTSAKTLYRLLDKLDVCAELQARTKARIVGSYTVDLVSRSRLTQIATADLGRA